MNDETRELRRPPRKPNVGWLHVGSIQGEGSSSMLWGMILNMSIQDQQGIGLPVTGVPDLPVARIRRPPGRRLGRPAPDRGLGDGEQVEVAMNRIPQVVLRVHPCRVVLGAPLPLPVAVPHPAQMRQRGGQVLLGLLATADRPGRRWPEGLGPSGGERRERGPVDALRPVPDPHRPDHGVIADG